MSLLYLSEDVLHQYMLKLHCIGGIGDDLTWLEAINVVVSTCWTCFVHHMRRCKNQIKTTFVFKVLVLFNAKYCELFTIFTSRKVLLFLWNTQKPKQIINCSIWLIIWTFQLSFYYDGTNEGIPQKYEIMYGGYHDLYNAVFLLQYLINHHFLWP